MNDSKIRFRCWCLSTLLLASCSQSSRDLQPEEVWRKVSPSVVRVEAKSLDGDTMIGSGFVCEMNGKKVILSNRHVVLGAKEVRVGSSAEKLFCSPVYRISPELDLALIDLPNELQVAPLRTRADGVRIGERVYALGFPLGLNKSITQGLVSSETEKLVQFDASISSGNSGGPLVDKNGVALGIVTAGSASTRDEIAQNLNFAIKTAFVPKAELFKEPIVGFYDAWRELVKVESKLIDDLQDLRVFDVETCVQSELALPLGYALHKEELANLDPEKKKEGERLYKATYADELSRVIQRHGTLESGVKSVVAFLRSKISEFDKVPELFAGIGSDDMLRSFGRDDRMKSLYKWDIKPSEIVPSLKVSIEFAKAKYEDEAYKIEFCSQSLRRLRDGDTNLIAILQKADAKWIGERTTIRLPYDKLNENASDEDRVRLFLLCDQTYADRSGRRPSPKLTTGTGSRFEKPSLTEKFSEYGGFETWITSTLFSKRALEQLERGDVQGAIGYLMNEVDAKRFPDLGLLAFLYTCNGDFEKAYDLYGRAYMATFDEVDPFSLIRDHSSARTLLLCDLAADRTDSTYSDSIKKNLKAWTRFISRKNTFVLAEPIPVSQSKQGGSEQSLAKNTSSAEDFSRILELKGITGPPERRIALINNLTFAKDEEGEVKAADSKVKIRLLEIREKSVIVRVEGAPTPIELTRSPKAPYQEIAAPDDAWTSALKARLSSAEFKRLSAFEKCWVLDAQKNSAVTNHRFSQFEDVVKANAETSELLSKMYPFPKSF